MMQASLWVLAIAGFCAAAPSGSCKDEMDCSLLGTCSANGECQCLKGWAGVDCGAADLAPLDTTLGYQNQTESSWGGRPIFDQKTQKWQLMATEIKNQCPLILFEYNSQVIRAVSQGADAGGPYTKAQVVLPPFHHNPTFVGPTPDGYYLLLYIGATNASNEIDCRHGIPNVPEHPNPPANGYITMASTKDIINGPWVERVILRDNNGSAGAAGWHFIQNNPSAQILSNGTIVVVFRANSATVPGEQLGVAVAPHWSAEFKTQPDPIVRHADRSSPSNEDPFVWMQPDGSWHIVNHQQSTNNVCGSSDAGHSCGAHWFARSPFGPWSMSKEPAYSASVTLLNGSKASFMTRQRPQIVFAEDGVTPAYLFTSGSFVGNNPDLNMVTHTYAQRFATN